MPTRRPTYFISHGGGPWPWLPDMRAQMHTLETSLANMPSEMAAIGAAYEDKATRTYYDQKIFGNITASSYRFG